MFYINFHILYESRVSTITLSYSQSEPTVILKNLHESHENFLSDWLLIANVWASTYANQVSV